MREQLLDTAVACAARQKNVLRYVYGGEQPNYPMPAIPQIHQWDYSLWCLLESIPPLSEEEWDREEELWQDYLDSLD